MILSSCGCKVSWGPADRSPFVALRHFPHTVGESSPRGMRLLREPPWLACAIHTANQVCPASLLLQAILPPTVRENPPDSPEPSISKSADFSMGTVVRYQSATLCRKCNKCRNFRFHAAGFTMIFTSAGLPTDWRSGSSRRMYPCASSNSSVGKISSVFLKNFPRHI